MSGQCRFPSAWTLLQALPISQLGEDVVQARPRLMQARCRAQLALSFLDDMAGKILDRDEQYAGWYRDDAKMLADEALGLTLEDHDAWLDEEKTHG